MDDVDSYDSVCANAQDEERQQRLEGLTLDLRRLEARLEYIEAEKASLAVDYNQIEIEISEVKKKIIEVNNG